MEHSLILTSLKIKAFANHANILLQAQDIHSINVLWIAVLQQVIMQGHYSMQILGKTDVLWKLTKKM